MAEEKAEELKEERRMVAIGGYFLFTCRVRMIIMFIIDMRV